MAKPKSAAGLYAKELCEQFPSANNKVLARKVRALHKELSDNAAECLIRRTRGSQGDTHRKNTIGQVQRTSKPSDNPNQCPPSAAEPWLPVQIDGPCRVLVLSDIHVPYHSKEAVEAAVAYGRKLKPDVVLLNGDTLDFHRISRFQQDPRKRTLSEEIETGKQLLAWIRRKFPKSRIIYKIGNHDQRWDVFLWNRAAELFDLENVQLHNVLDFESFGIERVDDNAIIAGALPILHGHEIGKGIFSPVNPARGAFLRTSHSVMIGHLHRSSSHAESDMWHKETMTWSTGCLCDLTPEYARVNRWNMGFASVDVSADNQFNVHNYRLSADYEVRTA